MPELAMLPAHPPTPKLRSGGRPTDSSILQIEVEFFDPSTGDGRWCVYDYPEVHEFDDWQVFESWAHKNLPFRRARIDEMLEFAHNFHCINVVRATGVMSPVIPRPTFTDLPLPGSSI